MANTHAVHVVHAVNSCVDIYPVARATGFTVDSPNMKPAIGALVALVLAATCHAQTPCTFYKPKNGAESKCWPSMSQLDAMAPANRAGSDG